MSTFAERVIDFNRKVEFHGRLPEGISIMNPFRSDDDYIMQVSSAFYRKYYDDNHPRQLILGINPGRFGAGFTGIPFTDTKRLTSECGIPYSGRQTQEPSSVFVYEVINEFVGPEKFYGNFYINSVSPLGFTQKGSGGKEKNYNYYDRPDLTDLRDPRCLCGLPELPGLHSLRDLPDLHSLRDLPDLRSLRGLPELRICLPSPACLR